MPTVFEGNNKAIKENTTKKEANNQIPHHYYVEDKKAVHRYLHSFCVYPSTTFEGQNKDETVILLLRAHPITLLPWIISAGVLFIIPFFFSFLIQQFFSVSQLIFFIGSWYSILFSYILVNLLNYLFNVGIVTNQRVIDVDYFNILYKEVNATLISKIEDVTTKIGGFVRSLFHFGNVFVQTAGAEINIEFPDVPEPTEAAQIINDLMQQSHS